MTDASRTKGMKTLGIDVARLLMALLVAGFIVVSGSTFALADVVDPEQVTRADEATVHPRGLAPQAQSPQDAVIPPQQDVDDSLRTQSAEEPEISTQSEDESEAPFFDDLEEAIENVRERAKRREGITSIVVSDEVLQRLDLENCSDILAHTTDPAGGDYLACAMVYYQATAEQQPDGTWAVEYYFAYFDDAEQELAATQATSEIVDRLGLHDESIGDYDKIKAIHDYIVDNVAYDYDTLDDGSAVHPAKFCGYGAIVEGNAVCQGYSCMFYRLALEAGIDCRIIRSDELNHAWNIVRLDGKHYLMDCTWDDTEGMTRYFLRGSRDFGHLNTDDEFSDDAFAQRYPLHEFARDSGSTISTDVVAPDYTLLTWDGRVTSTAAQNGRAKVLIFMWEGCGWTEQLIQSLVGKGAYPGVDVLICYMYYGVESHLPWLNKIGTSTEYPSDIPATYCYGGGSYTAMREMEALAGIYDDNLNFSPTVFFITSQNNILFADHGFAGNLDSLIYRYLADEDAPAPTDEPVDDTCRAVSACGDHAIWRFYPDGTLRIEGTGALYDNSYRVVGWLTERDWEELRSSEVMYGDGTTAQPYMDLLDEKGRYTLNPLDVKYVEVGEGITQLGAYVLSYFPNATIRFLGHAPTLTEEAVTYFDHAAITTEGYQIIVKYPINDVTWTQQMRDALTGKDDGVIWVPVDENGVHHHVWSAWEVLQYPTVNRTGRSERVCSECGATASRTIAKLKSIATAKVTLGASSYTYDGKAKSPGVKSVVLDGKTLVKNKDYRVRSVPTGRVKAGTYTYVVEGIGSYGGTAKASFTIKARKATPKVVLSKSSYVYNGKVRKPAVTVKVGTLTLKNGNDYSVSYASGCKVVGTYKVTVKLKGNYSGSASATFKIIKASQPMTVKASNRTASFATLKSKAVTVARPITISKQQGKLSYAKVTSGSSAYLTVNKTTGKVTVKKGVKKGTYTIKIKVTAAGNSNYKSGSKTVICKVIVK